MEASKTRSTERKASSEEASHWMISLQKLLHRKARRAAKEQQRGYYVRKLFCSMLLMQEYIYIYHYTFIKTHRIGLSLKPIVLNFES